MGSKGIMKDIVIIANFCRDFSESDNGRFMYLCKELSEENKVEIITSDFSHGKKQHKDALTIQWPFKITFLHESGYKKNVSIQRFLSHRGWGKNVKKYLEERTKPDVIYCAIPSLTAAKHAADYCEKNNVRFIVDIQDLWPEAFQMIFNVPVISNLVFYPFNKTVDRAYAAADEIIAVSQTYVNRALEVNSKVKKGHSVFLGTKLEKFDNYVKDNLVPKDQKHLCIAYCGTLGSSYDITCVIDALDILKNKYNNLKFLVMGDGPRREEFENRAKMKKIDVEFTGLLSYPEMCGRLVACDIAVNPITHGAAQSIINKHGDYAAAGLPVVNTQECEEYRSLVGEYNMGFNCANNDAKDVAEKLDVLIFNEHLRKGMGKNARKCAEERFDRKNSYQVIIDTIVG